MRGAINFCFDSHSVSRVLDTPILNLKITTSTPRRVIIHDNTPYTLSEGRRFFSPYHGVQQQPANIHCRRRRRLPPYGRGVYATVDAVAGGGAAAAAAVAAAKKILSVDGTEEGAGRVR